ncbi:MAG: T9SS type A sorting domain-containing protein [Bacteroidetes bacterium]|nr:MAG: T9SS type A sorting domain-containing protein [Bacteroidota bacterium]
MGGILTLSFMKRRITLFSIAALCVGFSLNSSAQILRGSTTVSGTNNMDITVTVNTNTNMVEIEMTGMNGTWFGYGFGGSSMSGRYTMITDGAGNFQERQLGTHTAGSALSSSATVTSNTTSGSVRTVVVSRSRVGQNASYYTFPNTATNISLIWAKGSGSSLSQHSSSNRGSSILTLQNICNFPATVLPNITVCSGDSAMIFGNWESQAGTYSTTLTSSVGCDSVVEQTLVVASSLSGNLPLITLCPGDSAMVFGDYVNTDGSYYDTLQSSGGCDSIVRQIVNTENLVPVVVQNGTTLNASGTNATSYDWIDCNTMQSTGVNSPIFNATANGMYAVIVTGNVCTDTSACFTITGIGIDENSVSTTLSQPNPFNDHLQIIGGSEGAEIRIFNTTGVEIYSATRESVSQDIPTTNWPAGLYIIQISTPSETLVQKVIKQ